jgi:hypothetical protein
MWLGLAVLALVVVGYALTEEVKACRFEGSVG